MPEQRNDGENGSASHQISRRTFLQWAVAASVLGKGPDLRAAQSSHGRLAREILREHPSIDIHAHPGRFHRGGTSVGETIEEMAQGGLTASFFCVSADKSIIGRGPSRGRLRAQREFYPGESYAYTSVQLEVLEKWISSSRLIPILAPEDIVRAKAKARPGTIRAVEGADFLEGKIERVQEAYDRDIRSIQLVHFTINALGDIQTEEARHGGLTQFGVDVVREMNRLGMIVDVAHASSDMTKKVADVTTKPIILSHTSLRRRPRKYSRAILADHARAVAETGGVIGVWPSGEGPFEKWINRFRRLSDVVGVEHVGMGTDMGGLRRTLFGNYKELPALVEGLLDGGFSKAEVAQILGGNFMRVFRTVAG